MNMQNRLEGLSARDDHHEEFVAKSAPPRPTEPRRRTGSLVLQIALGVWLGGLALGLTWYGLTLIVPELASLQPHLR